MTRAWTLWIAVLCSCASAQGSSDERLSDGTAQRSTTGAAASASAVPTSSNDAGVARTMADAGNPRAPACADLGAAFQARLAAASGACTTSANCACFTSIVESPACAGVTDATSARELNDLGAHFRTAGCQLPRRCGPGRCAPTCVDHRCR